MTVRAECEKCNHKWDLEMKPIKCCATCIHYWNCKYKNCRSNNWEHWESEVGK